MNELFYFQEDPCLANPCVNGGTCFKVGSRGYGCSCNSNSTGYNCETSFSNCKLFRHVKIKESFLCSNFSNDMHVPKWIHLYR